MINLRSRLLIGYGYMMVLLLLTAGSAAFGFFSISEAIDRILSENFQSVSASMEMMESLEEQKTLTVTALLESGTDIAPLDDAERAFYAAIDTARENATIDGEDELIDELQRQFEQYVEVQHEILADDVEAMPMEVFAFRIMPAFVETRQTVFALTELNHEAIVTADEEAQATALHMAGLLGVLVTIAMVSMVFLSRTLQQKVLRRLRDITKVAEAISAGDHHRRFDITINDELGVVSHQLNTALDTHDELQAEMRGRLNQQKQLVLGLLEEVEGELLLLGLDGTLIASSCERLQREKLEHVQKWLVDHRKEMLRDFRQSSTEVKMNMELDDQLLSMRLLAAGGERPVGWMVQVTEAECEPPNGSESEEES